MYFLYTRYLDLTSRHAIGEFASGDMMMRMQQIMRDNELKQKLMNGRVGNFPKSKKEFDRDRTKMEDISNELNEHMVMFFSVKEDANSDEKECITLHKGVWKKFVSTNDAIKEFFYSPDDHMHVETRIVYKN